MTSNGSFLYLIVSRLDTTYSVYLCVRFKSNPQELHLKAVERILHYIVGKTNQSFLYKKNQDFKLVGFCDAIMQEKQLKEKAQMSNALRNGNVTHTL